MRIAAVYDVHANLPALQAVLKEIAEAGVDGIVVGGDVLPGPMPRETLDALRDLPVPTHFIYGNGDRAVLECLAGSDLSTLPEHAREPVRWTAQQLDAEHQRLLAEWPATLRLDIAGVGGVLFCHATPRNDMEIFTRLTAEERLVPVFADVDAPLVVCGHTHMQFDRTAGTTRVVNAGSVGMPFGEPGADWLLLGPDVQLRHAAYDLADAADRIRRTGYPQADDFAARYVLRPPSAAQMLEAFGKCELR